MPLTLGRSERELLAVLARSFGCEALGETT
jgi:hypothetical protein